MRYVYNPGVRNQHDQPVGQGTSPEPFIAAILSGYNVRIPEMSFGEILATHDPELRKKLHTVCRRLLQVGTCIKPAHWVIDLHIKKFHANPNSYDWRSVDVRAADIEAEIHNGEFVEDDKLNQEQAAELRRLQDEFESWFLRSTATTGKPQSFAEWLTQSKVSGGSFWNTARLLYEAAFGPTSTVDTASVLTTSPDEATLEIFLDACPPVRALVYALELTLYDHGLRIENRPAYKAGRNDQMMAVFLPYCDQFLTNDRPQHKGLNEVAMTADIPVRVRLHDHFCSSHLVGQIHASD